MVQENPSVVNAPNLQQALMRKSDDVFQLGQQTG